MKAAKAQTTKIGRPREFSEVVALDAAMRVFWEKGFEGTSLDDLTEAMGINRSSLYSTFGDKESLFRRVIARYGEKQLAFVGDALKRQTARNVIETLWRGTVKFLADSTHPRGCLSLQGGLACGAGAESVKQAMIDWRRSGQVLIEKRMQRARSEGDLSKNLNPKDLARYVFIVMNGLSIQAVNGATPAEMNAVVDVALRSIHL
jgi:AcrR family transcriptional regulator